MYLKSSPLMVRKSKQKAGAVPFLSFCEKGWGAGVFSQAYQMVRARGSQPCTRTQPHGAQQTPTIIKRWGGILEDPMQFPFGSQFEEQHQRGPRCDDPYAVNNVKVSELC